MGFTKLKAALRALMTVVLSAASTSALADYTLNMPRGVTEISREVYDLHMLIFWICVAIGIVVFTAMIISIIYHRKSKNPEPAKWHHNTTVEIVWTVVPFLILVGMAIPAASTLIKMEDFRSSDISIKVTGMQWMWRYDYMVTDEDGVDRGFGFYSRLDNESNAIRQTGSGLDPFGKENYLLDVDNTMKVPVGKKVRILLTSADVLHAWWVPHFAVKKDAIPGFINEMWFNVDVPGIYRGQCAELCGRDHAFMPIVVEALPQEEYDAWVLEQQQQAGVAPSAEGDEQAAAEPVEWTTENAMRQGEQVYAQQCASCHQANGQGLDAAGFPALRGSPVASGDIAEHIDVVVNGRPNTAMMAFGGVLNDEQLAAVITYTRNAWGNDTGDLLEPSDIEAAR